MMVAYTTPDCLPYYECSDSPCLNTGTVCEPSTVWCDLTDIIDSRLTGYDQTLSRTAAAVPFVKVAQTKLQLNDYSIGGTTGRINFDTVLADNDNLVNLDVENQFINLNRAGLWRLELYMYGSPPPVVSNIFSSSLIRSDTTTTTVGTANALWRAVICFNRIGAVQVVTQADVDNSGGLFIGAVGSFRIGGGVGNNTVIVNYTELTAYWVSDL